MRKSAFTLVELLVVIGIIALLVAILLPALNKARLSAAVVNCAANIRQIHTAVVLYANDHKGSFPYSYGKDSDASTPQAEPHNQNWLDRVGSPIDASGTRGKGYIPYVHNRLHGVFRCPVYDMTPPGQLRSDFPVTASMYGLNLNLLAIRQDAATPGGSWGYNVANPNRLGRYGPPKLGRIPNRLLVIADGSFAGSGSGSTNFVNGGGPYYFDTVFNERYTKGYGAWPEWAPWPIERTSGAKVPFGQASRHGGVYNASFSDGHVEGLKTIDLDMLR